MQSFSVAALCWSIRLQAALANSIKYTNASASIMFPASLRYKTLFELFC